MQINAVSVGMVFTLAATLAVIQASSASKAQPTSDLEAGKLSPESYAGYLVVCGGNGTGPAVYLGYSYFCYAYDITAGTWSQMPVYDIEFDGYGRSGMGMTNHRGNIYLAGGFGPGTHCGDVCGGCSGSWYCNNGQQNDVHMYSDVLVHRNKKWMPGPPFEMNGGVRGDGLGAVSINNTIFVVGCNGGSDGYSFLLGLSFDVGYAAWQTLSPPSICHHYGGVAAVGGEIYACGSVAGQPSTFCERYNPSNDSWEASTPMNTPRANFQMVAIEGKLYTAGGVEGNNEFYDPKLDRWNYFSPSYPQFYFGAAATDGKFVYVVGGQEGLGTGPVNTLSIYHPEEYIWMPGTPYPQNISFASATFAAKKTWQ